MTFIKTLISDATRIDKRNFRQILYAYLIPRGTTFPYLVWLRLLQACRRRKILRYTLGFLVYPIYRYFEFKYGIHANPNIEIGQGLCVVHGGNVHLNCERIGKNLTVYQGVTFGIHEGKRPIVGDNVTAYPNSVIVGGVKVGDNATIGALSYVSHDVPPGATVVGSPARELKEIVI